VSGIGDLEREEQALYPLPESWRIFHGTSDTGGPGALPAGQLEARKVCALLMPGRPRLFWDPRGVVTPTGIFEMGMDFGADPTEDSKPMGESGPFGGQHRKTWDTDVR
jgi:hypothetical protein